MIYPTTNLIYYRCPCWEISCESADDVWILPLKVTIIHIQTVNDIDTLNQMDTY